MCGKFFAMSAAARSSSPKKINEEQKDALKNYRGEEQEDVQEEEEPAPGSASAEPRRKRTSNDAPAKEKEEEKGSRSERVPCRLHATILLCA